MMYRVLILFGILSLAVSRTAFAQAPPAKPPAAAAAAPPEEPLPPLSVPKDYRYNSRGRRDPFVNPVPKPVQKLGTVAGVVAPPSVRPDGLKGVLVAEIQIAGIVSSREPSMNVVTIAAPGGKKYFARVGDALYDAVVKSIKSDSVTFALTTPGLDPSVPRERTLKMHTTPGDQK
jgi:Tfp pilus assembly protein PilP